MKFKILEKYLLENKCYGFTVKRNRHTLIYRFFMMYRHNKKLPKKINVIINKRSKDILKVFIEQEEFDNINKFMNIIKFS